MFLVCFDAIFCAFSPACPLRFDPKGLAPSLPFLFFLASPLPQTLLLGFSKEGQSRAMMKYFSGPPSVS